MKFDSTVFISAMTGALVGYFIAFGILFCVGVVIGMMTALR